MLAGYVLIAPQMVGFAAFVLGPLIAVVYYSFTKYNNLTGDISFIGGDNYRKLLDDPLAIEVAQNTAVFSLGLVPLNICLALLLAVLLDQGLRGTIVFRAIFFSPTVVSVIAWTIVWSFLLSKDGGLNLLIRMVGADGPNWLREPDTAMFSVILVQVLKGVGVNMVLFLAALQSVPTELREAARVDGAPPWTIFRRITLPMISPTMLLAAIVTVIGSLQVFGQVMVLTGGGPGNATTVLAYYVYLQAFKFFDLGYASALAVLLFLAVLVLTVVQWWLRKKWVFHEQ
ncbi:sugar ABC transporter permease (plasmid) [Streptomyces sp. NBC_01591]|uniref:carbohydrate ABC transporter permease n=1 Tax=Streptomyces sp. NBC_01591 TaxID=2975888 RepID=UPI002DDB0AD0|nr:sugar ABC transporter permease [Streptomyces sp. NBC_01591]WSD73124.1 sugar ABC transporter permease [Streptomyces sp. NBC_01591]WSD73580.1 sugar ABC transporter permease [Streptomyces sp. NBC_01591]WSD74611.1 sugar ABC transporter permease [Streptomyces sp. NBC_01591]WSD74668.1 sugar ABC transporter permease [Streptomyces sp. NBC_01591]